MTQTMRVARVYGLEDVRVERMPVPRPGPGELLVRVSVCGVCSSDAMPWYLERKVPAVLGHEPVGVVEEVGPGVSEFGPGDRVFFHHHVPCLECRACMRGLYTACRRFRTSAIEPGGFAEYVRVPEDHVRIDALRIPDGVSDEAAVFIEPLACALHAFRKLDVRPGESVWVLGLGPLGLLNVMLARRFGAEPVIGSDPVEARRRYATMVGAHLVLDPNEGDLRDALRRATDGWGPDKVIVGPGTAAAVEQALEAAGAGTTVVLFTPTPPEEVVRLRAYELYFQEVTLTHSYSAGPTDTREALDLLSDGTLDVERLVTHRFGLEGVGEALRLVREYGAALRSVIYPHGIGVKVETV
ncbi:MAG: alcohol dehydrogenase catalytic domain-containing protein [Gemmatimonadetes bacterium]|nr:alcohol dehydrogenase catalytic domain-containing protein [Gemmatimonadota bacterium]